METVTIETSPGTGVDAQLLEAALVALPVALLVVAVPSGRTLVVSERAAELLGRGRGELDTAPIVRAARRGRDARVQLEIRLPRGSTRTLTAAVSAVRDGSGGIAAAAAVLIEDATAAARRAEGERDFVVNAAHELRTPIAIISSAVEVLQAGAKELPNERDLFLGHIERETERLTRLTRALLVTARAQVAAEAVPVEVVALRPLLAGVDAATRPAREVEVAVRCSARLAALTNRDLVEQALLNLATNAARYTPAGKIALAARRDRGAKVVVEVRDTGPGISPDLAEHAFDRFRRHGGGEESYGLGLSIARQAIESAGGSLELDTGPGGTVARIRLPLARIVA